jgi:hypothetical protein
VEEKMKMIVLAVAAATAIPACMVSKATASPGDAAAIVRASLQFDPVINVAAKKKASVQGPCPAD